MSLASIIALKATADITLDSIVYRVRRISNYDLFRAGAGYLHAQVDPRPSAPGQTEPTVDALERAEVLTLELGIVGAREEGMETFEQLRVVADLAAEDQPSNVLHYTAFPLEHAKRLIEEIQILSGTRKREAKGGVAPATFPGTDAPKAG